MTDQVTWRTRFAEPFDEDVWVNFHTQKDDWTVEGEIIQGPQGLAIRSIQIETSSPLGVAQGILRTFPIGEVLGQARALLAKGIDREATAPEAAPCSCGCRAHSDRLDGSRYTAMSDDFLRRVALAWIEEAVSEKRGAAMDRMAARFDRPTGTLRTWITRARRDGWLAPAARGRVGAEPGPKLLAAATTRSA